MSVDNISDVAGAANIGTGASLVSLLPMVLIFAIFYFFVIRPQLKRQRQVEAMVSKLQKGDKVIAAGGIHAVINKIEGEIVSLEIAENTKIKVAKSSITEVISSSLTASNNNLEEQKTVAKPVKTKATKSKKAE